MSHTGIHKSTVSTQRAPQKNWHTRTTAHDITNNYFAYLSDLEDKKSPSVRESSASFSHLPIIILNMYSRIFGALAGRKIHQ